MRKSLRMKERIFIFVLFVWLGRSESTISSILHGPIKLAISDPSGTNFAERESGPSPGRKSSGDEDHYLRVVSEMHNQSLTSGAKAQFKCKVEGYPAEDLTFTWYRSNKVVTSDTDPRYSIRQKEGTSRFQIRDVFTADSGKYRCEASNGVRRVHTEAFLQVSFVKPPPPSEGEIGESLIPKGKCEKYTGFACKSFFVNKYVYVDPYQTQQEVEKQIEMALRRITDPSIVSGNCQRHAVPALCYFVFPVCEEVDQVMSVLNGKKTPEQRATRLCREDCELLMHDVCKTEFANPDDDVFMEEIVTTANCSQLPPTTVRGTNCLKVGLPSIINRQYTCYNNTGNEYRGVQRKTVSGLVCKSWPFDLVRQYTELSGGHNFCRNPGNIEEKPWCFIDEARKIRQECDIPKCVVSTRENSLMRILIPSVTVPLFILCSVGIYFFCCRRNKDRRSSKGIPGKQVQNGSEMATVQMTLAPKAAPKIPQVNPQNLHFTMDLGDGQFGKVYKAQLSQNTNYNSNFPVAVKTLTEGSLPGQQEDFHREMEKFAEIQHPNVACLKAVVVHPNRRCMIFEYTNRVDLHEYLSLHSPHSDVGMSTKMSSSASSQTSSSLEPHDFINMMTQIASGMDYLTTRGYFHRDLAARNILVCQNNVLKICNLDVVRDCYLSSYYRSPQGGRMLPIRWMAPECIAHNTYSAKTSVWSFGVLVWEIYSYGLQPYCGYSNQEVLDMVMRFQLLTCPDQCPARVYSLTRECWAQDPATRPTFKEIYAKLSGWDNSNATRMTSQLARGIHRQVANIMKEGQYPQYSGIDTSSLPSYNTPSPPPTYNAVTGNSAFPNMHQQHPFVPQAAPSVSIASHNAFSQSSAATSSSGPMFSGQRLVVDLQGNQESCHPPQHYQPGYDAQNFPQRYYADHQNSQVYMGGTGRRPATQSSRSTSSCASSCSEYGPISRPSSAGHAYSIQQQHQGYPFGGAQQHQKFYGGIDYPAQSQHFQQQNIPNQRRPLSGVIEDESGLEVSRNSQINSPQSSAVGTPFSGGFSDNEPGLSSRDAGPQSSTEQTRPCDKKANEREQSDLPKIQNEETESSSSSSSAKAPSCDSGLPVDEEADVLGSHNPANQSTSITSPLLVPKPYVPRNQNTRGSSQKSPSDR